jgi:hypothetical protein
LNHLIRIAQLIKRRGDSVGEFPRSQNALSEAVGDLAYESSPYEQRGTPLKFDLKFVIDEGKPYSTIPDKPGIVFYSANSDGTQFVLTVSGLNAPIGTQASMMRAGAFVGEKQPWNGLLATEENIYHR